jgi:7-cyano-7-deazaguanine synthase
LGSILASATASSLECREDFRARGQSVSGWIARLGPDHMLDLSVVGRQRDGAHPRPKIALRADDLPNTFVPGRNLLYFTLAAALASRRQFRNLVAGKCEISLQVAFNLDMGSCSPVHIPFYGSTRRRPEIWSKMLGGEGQFALTRTGTHTCYRGDRDSLHDKSYGCGSCPACELRMKGREEHTTG